MVPKFFLFCAVSILLRISIIYILFVRACHLSVKIILHGFSRIIHFIVE